MSKITLNIIEHGNPAPVDPSGGSVNTGLFTYGIGAPEAAIIVSTILVLTIVGMVLATYIFRKCKKASKTSKLSPFIEINDGVITIKMGQGDTDALDSNGALTINGGTIDITGQSAFDYDGAGALNGGSVTVNGSAVNALTQTGPGGHGGMGGHGGRGGFGDNSGMGDSPQGNGDL